MRPAPSTPLATTPQDAADERQDAAGSSESLALDDAGQLTPWRDLFAQQAALELEMDVEGSARASARIDDARRRGAESELGYGQRMVAEMIAPLAEAISAFLDDAARGRGRKPLAALKLADIAPEKAALWTLRVLADNASDEPLLSSVALEAAGLVEDEARLGALRAADRKAAARLGERLARKSRRRARSGLLRRALEASEIDWTPWPRADAELVGLKLIDLALADSPFFEAVCARAGAERTEWRVRPTARLSAEIAEYAACAAALRPVYSPMVAAPRPFLRATSGGYLTSGARPTPLVKPQIGRRPRSEDAPTPENAPIVFAAANAAQGAPWRINAATLRVLEAALAGGPASIAAPPAEAAPEPEAEAASAAAWRRRAEWAAAERARRARRQAVERACAEARRFARFTQIYFPAQYDFRGRLYFLPSFNPQGPDVMRGLLSFARGKPLGAEGWKWLAIHLCNCGDFNKMSKAPLGERVGWTLENEERILAVAADPEADLFWTEADKPWQFLAACFEWAGYRSDGEGFVSHLPIALDGACSGLQHFSLALRDEVGGAAVNLAPREGRAADIYEEVAARVRTRLEADVSAGAAPDASEAARDAAAHAAAWRAFGVDRKLCKRPTMTYGYGARSFGYTEQIMTDVLAPAYEAHRAGRRDWPFEGRGFHAATFMAARLTSAIEETVVKAASAMRWLQDCASLAAEEGLGLVWTAPDGFIVRQEYFETRERRVRAAIAGKPVRLCLRAPLRSLDRRRQRQGAAPNFVHALDGCHLRLTVARASEEGVRDFALVHDSFGVHAADTPRFFQLLRETMIEMYETADVMADFADALAARLSEERRARTPAPPEPGALPLEGVLESEFCFS